MRVFKSILCGILVVMFCIGLIVSIASVPAITLTILLMVLAIVVASNFFYEEVFT